MNSIPRSGMTPRPTSIDSDHDVELSLPVTPHHRSVLAVDIEGSTTRTNVERAKVRRVMYDLLEEALQSAGIGDRCRDELIDRGDGILALIHPVYQAPKTLLLASVMPTLSLLLTHHNARHHADPLRMRAVMHAGEVHYDDRGCFGEDVDLSFRLLNAPELKRRLAGIEGSLVLVVSEAIYTSVVRHGYEGIDDQDFEPLVHVGMAGRRHRGWVSVPEAAMIPRQRIRPVTDLDSRR
jgi:class 3 adenylate cyclase